ncbi:MAG: N-methyl-L-tryptophan oxidase [Candidatus Tectomicrobia bacterium]|uniref:N-methyl-L-tryptophan oxidase n=1 Tax=Tectimicrobiota bacterium TaxID=2528274 RepID=A0A937VZ15_UNCTE|nr:N-methyl-L-tryptophan oxidase [Candidatus Tectomicrobia bacterium]
METYDVIVVGVGGMGSAAVYHLARRGVRVLGLEQYDIPHNQGSSHGLSRIIRLAYFEHPSYVPLLQRAYALWWALEHEVQERLLLVTGSLDIGTADSPILRGAVQAAQLHHLVHEVLEPAAIRRRFPGYGLHEPLLGLYQPQGGLLVAERCIVAHVQAALNHGAVIHGREAMTGWESDGVDLVLHTSRGVYRTRRLVLTAGAWTHRLVAAYRDMLQPERQVLIWMQPRVPAHFQPAMFPVFNMAVEEGTFYGLPIYGSPGFKFGRWHHLEQAVDDPTSMDRACHPEDEAVLRAFARRYFPDGDGPTLSMQTCLFTNTPDTHFVIDAHPAYPNVFIAGGFSGHGFKFCSVVGEILADLAQEGSTSHDIALFQAARFHKRALV